jgi:hypothetical protein
MEAVMARLGFCQRLFLRSAARIESGLFGRLVALIVTAT